MSTAPTKHSLPGKHHAAVAGIVTGGFLIAVALTFLLIALVTTDTSMLARIVCGTVALIVGALSVYVLTRSGRYLYRWQAWLGAWRHGEATLDDEPR